jgi:hypothetical protein
MTATQPLRALTDPPLSITEVITQGYAPIPFESLKDLMPANPHAALHWCIQRTAELGASLGLDERTLLGLLSNHITLTGGDPHDTVVSKFWNAYLVDTTCEGL